MPANAGFTLRYVIPLGGEAAGPPGKGDIKEMGLLRVEEPRYESDYSLTVKPSQARPLLTNS